MGWSDRIVRVHSYVRDFAGGTVRSIRCDRAEAFILGSVDTGWPDDCGVLRFDNVHNYSQYVG